MGKLIDPAMLAELDDFYLSRCTIQSDTDAGQSASGEPQDDWEDVTGLSNIPCSVGPSDSSYSPATGTEQVRAGDTLTQATHRIALQGHYPQITEKMQAVVDGRTFNILQVLHDSQKASTYLDTESIT